MSNEELALLIQAGDDGYLPQLWEQVRWFIALKAYRFHNRLDGRRGIDVDDLIQSGYFAVLRAVKYYAPAKGYKFTSFLNFTLKTAFCNTAGFRKGNMDAIFAAVSLDAPLNTEDGDLSLLDSIEDIHSEENYIAVEESQYTKQLRAVLDDALSILGDTDRRQLEQYFYFGLTNKQIAEAHGMSISAVEARRQKSFLRIRRSSHSEKLRAYIFWYADDDLYHEVWHGSWRKAITY